MNKIITFTILAIIVFSWLVTNNTTKQEKNLLANEPFIIKSNLPGTCSVSTMTTSTDTKQFIPAVACKISITTATTSGTQHHTYTDYAAARMTQYSFCYLVWTLQTG